MRKKIKLLLEKLELTFMVDIFANNVKISTTIINNHTWFVIILI